MYLHLVIWMRATVATWTSYICMAITSESELRCTDPREYAEPAFKPVCLYMNSFGTCSTSLTWLCIVAAGDLSCACVPAKIGLLTHITVLTLLYPCNSKRHLAEPLRQGTTQAAIAAQVPSKKEYLKGDKGLLNAICPFRSRLAKHSCFSMALSATSDEATRGQQQWTLTPSHLRLPHLIHLCDRTLHHLELRHRTYRAFHKALIKVGHGTVPPNVIQVYCYTPTYTP